MSTISSFIPEEPDSLSAFEVTYQNGQGHPSLYTVPAAKNIGNALASFGRAVPQHGPIRGIRKVSGRLT